MDFGLWYAKSKDFTLVAYLDADLVECIDDRKSTSGGAFYLGHSLVSWHSKKQESVVLSTAEVEYIAATATCTPVIWMKRQIEDLGIQCQSPIIIKCDNSSAINISKNPV